MNIWNIHGSTSPKKSQRVIADIHSKSFEVAWEQHHFQSFNWKSMTIASLVHFRCGSMTSSWPVFGVSLQIIALLHLTYYKITNHHSWTKRPIPPNPTPPFCRGPRDPSMAFLARLSTPSSAIEAPKVASARPSTLPGNQVVIRKWSDSGVVVKYGMFMGFLAFFGTEKYRVFFQLTKKKMDFLVFQQVQVFL